MARFTYRMQNILNITEKMESQAKIAYSTAARALSDEQERLSELLVKKADLNATLKKSTSGDINIMSIKRINDSISIMDLLIKDQMAAVIRAENLLEERRAALKKEMIKRKTHEKLKEKAFEEFKKEEIHKEDKAVDELTAFTHRSR
jgi:flagellar FliJ protein